MCHLLFTSITYACQHELMFDFCPLFLFVVDIWSVGCIFAELARGDILLKGRDCILPMADAASICFFECIDIFMIFQIVRANIPSLTPTPTYIYICTHTHMHMHMHMHMHTHTHTHTPTHTLTYNYHHHRSPFVFGYLKPM